MPLGSGLPPLDSTSFSAYPSTNASLYGPPPTGLPYMPSNSSSIMPNMRSGSWSQVENALPPLGPLSGNHPRLGGSSSHVGMNHPTALASGMPSLPGNDSLFTNMNEPAFMPNVSRPGNQGRGLRRSASSASLASSSGWNSGSKTPALSMEGSRRSTSSDEDDPYGMPSTASASPAFLQSPFSNPFTAASPVAGIHRSKTPGFGLDQSRPTSPAFGIMPSARMSSLSSVDAFDLPLSSSTNRFPQLSSSHYPAATPYTPSYSRNLSQQGAPSPMVYSTDPFGTYNSRGLPPISTGHPGITFRQGGLLAMSAVSATSSQSSSSFPSSNSGSFPAFPTLKSPSLPNSDLFGASHSRRLSRHSSYAGLSRFEGSGA